jgi:histidyl-tRNA synthetase
MKSVLLSPISGFPEYSPAEQVILDRMLRSIENSFRLYGYQHIETPSVERKEVLTTKGGDAKEIYALSRLSAISDENPETDLALHFDLTVPLARYVAAREREITFPLRRYQIQKVWRGERSQVGRGRYREFYQCDVDIVGRQSLPTRADAEVAGIVYRTFQELTSAFNLGQFVIRISNRSLIEGFLQSQGVSREWTPRVLGVLDGLEKRSLEDSRRELADIGLQPSSTKNLLEFCGRRGAWHFMLPELTALSDNITSNEQFRRGLAELKDLFGHLQLMGLPLAQYEVDLGIIRGLDYYTGFLLETQLVDHQKLGSICSGGRYDNLVGQFSRTALPGVGISIGATRLFAGLLEAGVLSQVLSPFDGGVLIIRLDPKFEPEYHAIADELRSGGIPCEVYLYDRRLKDQLEYGNRRGFAVCVIMGSVEAEQATVQLKVMKSGVSVICHRSEVVARVRAALSSEVM